MSDTREIEAGAPVGIIGGFGFATLPGFAQERNDPVDTPYGAPSAPPRRGRIAEQRVVFLARHGEPPHIPPHRVNYRANLWALEAAGVRAVLSINAVGAIRADLRPGDLVVPDQLIDYTYGRAHTYSEDGTDPVAHIDFTRPYDDDLRAWLIASAAAAGARLRDGATYGATQGPRLETAAEIDRFERDGCDVVGMTGMPEAALARELGLRYASLSIVANRAAGRGAIDIHAELEQVLQHAVERVGELLEHILREPVLSRVRP